MDYSPVMSETANTGLQPAPRRVLVADTYLARIADCLDLACERDEVAENAAAALDGILTAAHADMTAASPDAVIRILSALARIRDPLTERLAPSMGPDSVGFALASAGGIVRLFGATAEDAARVDLDNFGNWLDAVAVLVAEIGIKLRLERMGNRCERRGWSPPSADVTRH